MIIGHIQNLAREMQALPASVQKALDFIQKNDCARLAPGKYEIDGDKIFALVQQYQTKEPKDCRAETHAKYLDIQYIAKGREYMGYAPLGSALAVEEDCLAERDAVFYKQDYPQSDILLSEGMYAVLYPTDVHCPGRMVEAPEDVVKLVCKISVGTLK